MYNGIFYGTLKSEVDRLWAAKKTVIFDLDVQGGITIKKYYQDRALALFLRPPSVQILEERLRNRSTESASQFEERIAKAKT